MNITRWLVPKIAWDDFPAMFGVAILGALIAGCYGIVHDQITYAIGPEYFTKFKFEQFRYADFGFPNWVFVSEIGFLATWWVGFAIAWFLARWLIPDQPRVAAYRRILKAIGIVFCCGCVSGLVGFAYGNWRGPDSDYYDWEYLTRGMGLTEIWPFVRVAYIHNAGYLGGLIGLVLALWLIRPEPKISKAKVVSREERTQ
ncbi:MAG: hypothetical protein ACI87E_004994 [Mariniblastus sp.]|jgi:hypothetical protein